MMVRASACLQALQQRAGPHQRPGGLLLPTLAMIASAVCGAIASFHLIGSLQAAFVRQPDRATGREDLPIMSGERCMEQVARRP
ncbi:MAG: hypothetical protein J0H65_14270 [Rhizobiales bacterium]|nr:hypothetical protein [Hyphomicrobiales bacterium]